MLRCKKSSPSSTQPQHYDCGRRCNLILPTYLQWGALPGGVVRHWNAERWKLNEIKLNRDPVKIQLSFYLRTGIALIFINLWDSSHYHPDSHSHYSSHLSSCGRRRTMEWCCLLMPILIGNAQHQCSQRITRMDATLVDWLPLDL